MLAKYLPVPASLHCNDNPHPIFLSPARVRGFFCQYRRAQSFSTGIIEGTCRYGSYHFRLKSGPRPVCAAAGAAFEHPMADARQPHQRKFARFAFRPARARRNFAADDIFRDCWVKRHVPRRSIARFGLVACRHARLADSVRKFFAQQPARHQRS